jgi:hypothetical protein
MTKIFWCSSMNTSFATAYRPFTFYVAFLPSTEIRQQDTTNCAQCTGHLASLVITIDIVLAATGAREALLLGTTAGASLDAKSRAEGRYHGLRHETPPNATSSW